MAMVLMPPVYKNEADLEYLRNTKFLLELTLLTIMAVMAVSGALASIRKDFII